LGCSWQPPQQQQRKHQIRQPQTLQQQQNQMQQLLTLQHQQLMQQHTVLKQHLHAGQLLPMSGCLFRHCCSCVSQAAPNCVQHLQQQQLLARQTQMQAAAAAAARQQCSVTLSGV
jgi:hypothetical protein